MSGSQNAVICGLGTTILSATSLGGNGYYSISGRLSLPRLASGSFASEVVVKVYNVLNGGLDGDPVYTSNPGDDGFTAETYMMNNEGIGLVLSSDAAIDQDPNLVKCTVQITQSTGAGSFPLPVTSGLAFWLDATDRSTMTLVSGKVSVWTDKSGNGFNWARSQAGTRPVYDSTLFNGRGGVIFDYTTGTGVLSDAAASTITQGEFTYFLVGIRTDGILSAVLQDFGSGTIYGPAEYNNRWGLGQGGVIALGGIPKNIRYTMGFRNTGDTATAYFFDSDGTKQNLIYGQNLPTGSGTMGNLSFGGKDFGAHQGWSMDCATILMYNRALTDTEVGLVCDWIRFMYGVGRVIPRTQNINFSGDSITAGLHSDGGTGFMELAMESLGIAGDQYTASAIPGQQIAAINTTDATYVDPIYNASFAKNIIAFMGGTNDIGNGADAATVQTSIQNYCTARRAVGWKVLVATILPTTIADFNDVRNDVNTWLAANHGSFCDGLIDVASDPVMGPDAAASDITLYDDGVHPTALGHSLLAPYYADAIDALL